MRSCPTLSPTSPAAHVSTTREFRWSCSGDTEDGRKLYARRASVNTSEALPHRHLPLHAAVQAIERMRDGELDDEETEQIGAHRAAGAPRDIARAADELR